MMTSPKLKQAMHPAQVFDIKAPSISLLKKDIGEVKLSALIKAHLINLNDLLGLSKPLTEVQIDWIADTILAQHYNLTMIDLYIIIKRAITGYYGEFYERLSPPKSVGVVLGLLQGAL